MPSSARSTPRPLRGTCKYLRMAFLVIAYPKISQEDFDWIQEYRKRNDPRYFGIVKPHFSIVFPVGDLEQEAFLEEAKKQAVGAKKFNFELKVATINKDGFGGFYHEFLVPDKGYSDIVKLHDKLYSGAFSGQLRLDLDFIPHVGIGNSDEAAVSKSRVDELNAVGVNISGTIDMLDIVAYENDAITTVGTIPLS